MANIPPPSSLLASTPPASRKVAIPRLQHPGQTKNPLKERRRVTRACTACRTHKIKCTGETPQCKHCANTNRQCVYVLPRRDRLKTVTEQCVQMAGLLNELRSRVNEEDNARISDLLERVEENISDIRQTSAPSIPDTEAEGSKGSREYGTQNTPLPKLNQVNTDSLDLLNENLQKNEQARATGFIGQNSVLQWLRTISGLQMDRSSDDSLKSVLERRYSTGAEGVSSFTFWMDGDNVDVDFYVDPYEFPAMDTAERLLSCYLTRVHDSFPILPRKPFEDQFRKYFTSYHSGNSPRVNHKWQATLNMVFAIGARYSHLVKANWRADERDHLIYHARARALVVNEYTLTEHPDVPQIQALGLVAFYWFSTGQVSRAWTIIGLAVRCAYSLGLHVRNEDPSASAAKRETLVRVWWSLYSLERTLSIVVGRPSLIVDVCCSVPLPIPVPEDQITDEVEIAFRAHKGGSTVPVPSPVLGMRSSSGLDATPRTPVGLGTNDANSGSYFKATIQLHIITQDILTSLYSAGTLIRSLNDIQQDMVQLNQRLDEWSLSLPSEFNFEVQSTPGIVFTRERMILGFQLCNAKMLLARPCLGTLGRSSKEASDSEFTKRMASICIEAARATVDLIPDQPNPLFIYDQGPWWNIVHHLMQAFSVFLLALSYGPPMSQDNNYPLAQYVKKIIRWLRTMPDPLADRAYRVALKTFIGVAAQLSMDVSDLWMENTTTASADQNFQHSGMGVNIHTQFDTMTYADPAAMATTAYPLQPGPPFLDNQHFNTM